MPAAEKEKEEARTHFSGSPHAEEAFTAQPTQAVGASGGCFNEPNLAKGKVRHIVTLFHGTGAPGDVANQGPTCSRHRRIKEADIDASIAGQGRPGPSVAPTPFQARLTGGTPPPPGKNRVKDPGSW